MDYKIIKIAHLANQLDQKNKVESASKLDNILVELSQFNVKLSQVDDGNKATFLKYNQDFMKLANKLEDVLSRINNKESENLIKEFKEAGGFWQGLGNALTAPFAGIGNWFNDQIAGGKFKSILDNSIKNLGKIKNLINGGNEEEAKKMIYENVDSMLSLLKENFGDLTTIQSQAPEEPEPEAEADALTPDPTPEPPAPAPAEPELAAASSVKMIKSAIAGSVRLMEDLETIKREIEQGADIATIWNDHVGVLTEVSEIQPDKKSDLPAGRRQDHGRDRRGRDRRGWYGRDKYDDGGYGIDSRDGLPSVDPGLRTQIERLADPRVAHELLKEEYPELNGHEINRLINKINPYLTMKWNRPR